VSVQQALIASASSTDPYAAFRVTIANLNINLSDPKRIWTAHGDAAVSGDWLNLDGAGDYIDTPQSTDFDFGSGSFSVEAFVQISGAPAGPVPIMAKWQTGLLSWYLGLNASRQAVMFARIAGGNYFPPATTATVALNTPTHVAMYRIGNNFYLAVGGVVQNVLSQAGSIDVTSQPVAIGAQPDGSNNFAGLIRGARVTKGSTGGYGATNFTPPSFPLPTS